LLTHRSWYGHPLAPFQRYCKPSNERQAKAGDEAHELCTIADKCRRTSLAAEACGHDDPAIIQLLTSTQPTALRLSGCLTVADVGDDAVAVRSPHQLAAATGCPAAVVSLLADAAVSIVAREYNALATLVDGEAQEMERIHVRSELYVLVVRRQWQAAVVHISGLSDSAVNQLFAAIDSATPIMIACYRSASLKLVQLMITKAKLDERKRCMSISVCSDIMHYFDEDVRRKQSKVDAQFQS